MRHIPKPSHFQTRENHNIYGVTFNNIVNPSDIPLYSISSIYLTKYAAIFIKQEYALGLFIYGTLEQHMILIINVTNKLFSYDRGFSFT